MKPIFYFSAILISLLSIQGFAQSDSVIFLNKLQSVHKQSPQEKVHLHLDKPYYSIGDTIWFQAYVVDAERNELSKLSKVVYVDLVNEMDSVKLTRRLLLEVGRASGDFILSDTLREGNYRIFGYTNWMRNFGSAAFGEEEYFFNKVVPVGNSFNNLTAKADYTVTKKGNIEEVIAEINYHDLSGKAVTGKEVTYEIISPSGRSVKGKGVTNSLGNLQVKFSAAASGTVKISTKVKPDDVTEVEKELFYRAGSQATAIQFFPEGGQLVNGITSRVGFKAVGGDGTGREVSGYITDKDNKQITAFKSEHAGMGSFMLTPTPGQNYTAIINLEDGTEQKVKLPVSALTGYVLTVTQDKDNLQVHAESSKEGQGKEIILLGQTNGVVNFMGKNKLTASFNAVIPKSRFPGGILQLTLFDVTYQPLAERLVFIDHESNQIKVKLNTDKTIYQKREKMVMELELRDQKGNPVQGSFSLAVTDEGKVSYDEEKETTIRSNLLLSSDLKGYIENPNYYFTNTDTNKIKQLDNLLLTQGWRRFAWKELRAGLVPSFKYKAEQGIGISGRLLTLDDKPMKQRKLSVEFSGGSTPTLNTTSDSEGRFHVDNLALNNAGNFTVRVTDLRGSAEVAVIEIDRPSPQKIHLDYWASNLSTDSSMLTYLQSSREYFNELKERGMLKGVALKEVTITATKKSIKQEILEQVVPNSSNLNGKGNADQVVTFWDLQNCSDLPKCLTTRLGGVKIINNMAYGLRQSTAAAMLLVVDGVNSGFDLSTIPANDIESIEVLKPGPRTAVYGFDGYQGVLIFNTKKGGIDYLGYELERAKPGFLEAGKIKSHPLQGYYQFREFYSPDYANPATNTQIADLRSTVYWNPNIITDTNGKAKVEFYNADGTGNYRVITEGLTEDGKLGRLVIRYNVK